MSVQTVGERYICNVCGNEIVVAVVGGGELVCCGVEMELMEE
ncbi:MAG: desulfoferrodoxin [Dehalococcoidia bacterium]|nr:desulfoferrodoxin [Dehalococcoidia bacterium]